MGTSVVPSGTPVDFEWTVPGATASNFAAYKFYDLSSGSATLLGTLGLTFVYNGTWWGTYTFPANYAGKNILVQKSTYTDGTYTTPDGLNSGSDICLIDGNSLVARAT